MSDGVLLDFCPATEGGSLSVLLEKAEGSAKPQYQLLLEQRPCRREGHWLKRTNQMLERGWHRSGKPLHSER
uniref:Uncharacterized protein n=1 Tax=Rhizophora mucronata TaxID=61149 RepID=A0A2P2IQG8_RHIMU